MAPLRGLFAARHACTRKPRKSRLRACLVCRGWEEAESSASSELRPRECSGETCCGLFLIALDRCDPGSSSSQSGSPVGSGHGRQRSSAATAIRVGHRRRPQRCGGIAAQRRMHQLAQSATTAAVSAAGADGRARAAGPGHRRCIAGVRWPQQIQEVRPLRRRGPIKVALLRRLRHARLRRRRRGDRRLPGRVVLFRRRGERRGADRFTAPINGARRGSASHNCISVPRRCRHLKMWRALVRRRST